MSQSGKLARRGHPAQLSCHKPYLYILSLSKPHPFLPHISETARQFDSFKSKNILSSSKSSPSDQMTKANSDRTPWISKNPEKPADHPVRVRNRRTALSVKEVREAAVKLQKSDRDHCHQPDKVRSDGNEVGSDPSVAQVGKSKKKLDGQIKLPEKFEILGKFFDSLDVSIWLLRLKGSGSTFANISPKIERLTDRRFSYGHLAQLKFILPEVIEIKKIFVHDEKTSCMKPDLHVTLNVDAIKNERKPNASGNSHMRKVFHARLLDFFKAHPKGEVPEETLPEPFNQLKQDVHISTAKASDPSLLRGTLADALAEQQPTAAASHLSQSFRKRFSQKVSRSEAVDSYQGQPIVSLQLSIREKEKKTLEEQDPAISKAKRRYQMIASLPKLFDIILFLFQSIKRSVMTKEELMHRIVCSHLDIVDRREVEEQLKLLQELIPEWMYEKLASSGDILVCINKISSPELMRARLVEAK